MSSNTNAIFSSALLVEDEPNLATTLKVALTKLGIAVDHVSSIEDAEQAVAEKAPSLILLDRSLPDGDGLSLCKKLRESYEVDEPNYFDQQMVTTFDITAPSGEWPVSIVEPDPEDTDTATVRHRLVLFAVDRHHDRFSVGRKLRTAYRATGLLRHRFLRWE